MQQIKGLIFDMDGVIVDSEPLHLRAYQQYFAPLNIVYTEEENQEFLGCKDIVQAKTLIERHRLDETPESLVSAKERNLCALLQEEGVARPGLDTIMQRAGAAGLPMAIASSATLATINIVVDRLNIRRHFASLTSGEEVKHGKPAPDVFLLAASRLGIEPEHCLVIEDTLNGIKAAKAAGMICISIPCEQTMHQDHSLADFHLSSLAEVEFVGQMPGRVSLPL